MTKLPQNPDDHRDYARVERAIAFLQTHHRDQPVLGQLAQHIGLRESQTQRLFSRWAGISPKRFLQYLTVEHAKNRMIETRDLLDLSLDAGLSGPGRLHDLFVNMEAMSPGEFRRAAEDLEIRYGAADSPFGRALVAITERGICHLSFIDDRRPEDILAGLRERWPGARLVADDGQAAAVLAQVFRPQRDDGQRLSLWVSGSNFQIQVWRALLQLPFGGVLSYRQVATMIGRPRAARAVGTAIAQNRIAFLIPCHRVLRGTGEFGVYHWGTARKAAICGWECARQDGMSLDPAGTGVLD